VTGEQDPGSSRPCPWCSAPVPTGATHCPMCGDAVVQREGIDGLGIAGVTIVDPALAADPADPLDIPPLTPSSVDPLGGTINLSGMAELASIAAIGHGGAVTPPDRASSGRLVMRFARRPNPSMARTRPADVVRLMPTSAQVRARRHSCRRRLCKDRSTLTRATAGPITPNGVLSALKSGPTGSKNWVKTQQGAPDRSGSAGRLGGIALPDAKAGPAGPLGQGRSPAATCPRAFRRLGGLSLGAG